MDRDHADDDKRTRVVETPEERTRNPERHEHAPREAWGRDDFMHDLSRASRRLTAEIEADPEEAAALDRARKQSREGRRVTQDELDRELDDSE